MTDRGLPLVNGAPACPFVAFEEDRDARATSPDHRHRCYAEVRPAPRALAHQEAYCLSSAFPVCPTFQDWARREAAQARAAAAAEAGDGETERPDGARPGDDRSEPGQGSARLDSSQRNPPRNWAAPPPWLSSHDDPDDEPPEVQAQPPIRGGGLAGSFADRLAGGGVGGGAAGPGTAGGAGQAPVPGRPSSPPAGLPPAGPPPAMAPPARSAPGPARWHDDEEADDDDREAAWDERRPPSRARRSGRDDRPPAAIPGPSWERPRRLEAYPTLKTRIGLPTLRLPPILLGVAAVALGAVALFFLPLLLGIGNDPGAGAATSTPGSTTLPSATPGEPTPTPAPTPFVYVVQGGDTMSTIADRFNVTLDALKAANPQIENVDLIDVGDEIIIPIAAPTTLPGVTPTPTPVP